MNLVTCSYDLESLSKWLLSATNIRYPVWHTFRGPAGAHSLTDHHLRSCTLRVPQWMGLDCVLCPAANMSSWLGSHTG